MRNPPPTRRRDFARRSTGILLHLTSLPGVHGAGDLGPEAHRFLEFLERAGQSWWQMLPIGPPGRAPGFSPYDSASAFAGSPWLVSPLCAAYPGNHDNHTTVGWFQDLRPEQRRRVLASPPLPKTTIHNI